MTSILGNPGKADGLFFFLGLKQSSFLSILVCEATRTQCEMHENVLQFHYLRRGRGVDT